MGSAVLCAALLCVSALGQHPLPLTDPHNTQQWEPYEPMTDEFDGTSLNTTKWGKMSWLGRQPAAFEMHNVKVADGQLQLWARHEVITDPNLKKLGYGNYTTAAVRSEVQTAYGYWEIKAKPGDSSITSSFWFSTQNHTGGHWALELDIFEAGGKGAGPKVDQNLMSHVHLWATPWSSSPSIEQEKCHCKPDNQPRAPCSYGNTSALPFVLSDAFHVYGFEWNTTQLTIYVDGEVRWVRRNYCSVAPVALIFDRETFSWWGLPPFNTLPDDPFRIEYIRVWKSKAAQNDVGTIRRQPHAKWGLAPGSHKNL